jgi:hypothetical protein
MKQMLKVKDNGQIWFAIFTFSGSSGIDDTMLALARGGVRIRGVLDAGQAHHGWAAPQWLRHPNIELRIPKKAGDLAKLRKLDHKLMVIDDRIVVAGSFNCIQPANDYNDENLFVVGSPHSEVGGIDVMADPVKEIAVHMRAEIERLFDLSERSCRPCQPKPFRGGPLSSGVRLASRRRRSAARAEAQLARWLVPREGGLHRPLDMRFLQDPRNRRAPSRSPRRRPPTAGEGLRS